MSQSSADSGVATARVLKSDLFGAVAIDEAHGAKHVRRDTAPAAPGLRWLARLLAANEARSLRRLADLGDVPGLLDWNGRRVLRGYLEGGPMSPSRPPTPAYFSQARRLLQAMHRRGVAHNDLAKEANWLVTPDGRPALVDFQIAWRARPRSPWLRLLAREDLRHLLKHKRTYCPERLTPVERRLLKRHSWLRRLWFATGKPVYRFVTRRLLRWEDNEGRNPAQ